MSQAISEARIEANRRNAQLSTGARTDAGKTQSRSNAVKHGLASGGEVLATNDREEVGVRLKSWREQLGPLGALGDWILHDLVVATVQLDRIERIDAAREEEDRQRAEDSWDEERRLDAEKLGALLPQQPEIVSRQLERTPHGCAWKIDRWRQLSHWYRMPSSIFPELSSLAHDLLGTPRLFRTPHSPNVRAESAYEPGRVEPDRRLHETCLREIERLEMVKKKLEDGADALARSHARNGVAAVSDLSSQLVRRYEGRALRRVEARLKQLMTILGGGVRNPSDSSTTGADLALYPASSFSPPQSPPERLEDAGDDANLNERSCPPCSSVSPPSQDPTPLSATEPNNSVADEPTSLATAPRSSPPAPNEQS